MKLTFIGRGGALMSPLSIGHSNMLFEEDGKKMLLDAGASAQFILPEMGIMANDIDAIYVSHLHNDHTGSIEWLGFYNYFMGKDKGNGDKRPIMFGVCDVLKDLWEHTLKGGMECIQGKMTTLDTFFNVQAVEKNKAFFWQGWKFQPVQTIHVVAGYSFQHSYGLLINKMGDHFSKTTFITTDTQFSFPCPLQCFYDAADLIFHDCETKFKSGVHSFYGDMNAQLNAETKAKMWLYHYTTKEESNDGFAGWVQKGQEFIL